jgi:hypothetical protein
MITVTRTPKGIRIEGADRHESISRDLLDQVRAGDSPVMVVDKDLLTICDDFGNIYNYRIDLRPVMNGSMVFYRMERQ